MGLDVTAYRQLTAAPDGAAGEDGDPRDGYVRLDDGMEANFPGRMQGIAAGVYRFAERFDFSVGSSTGYNQWRDWLAHIAGYGSAEAVWDAVARDPGMRGPFVELIDFADNEGVIGPVVSAKLAQDFAAHQARVDALAGAAESDFVEHYALWRKAFKMAADHGAVNFH